jgi:chromosome segregation ATPase
MTRSYRAFGPLLLALAVAWGCAPSPAGSDRSREAKAQRLEEDFRAAAAARDDLRAKLAAAEERQAAAERRAAWLQGQFDQARAGQAAAARERDGVRAERDAVAAQYDGFRKNLKALLGQAEGAPSESASPATVGATAPPAAALSN